MASRMIGEPDPQARPVPDPTVSVPVVRTFHQILFWPLQLVPLRKGSQVHHHWELLERDPGRVWKEVDDDFAPILTVSRSGTIASS